jgi:DNA primase
MISEKYPLSKIHSKFREIETDEKRLTELAPRYIYEFKLALIMNQRKEKLLELKNANENGDLEMLKRLMIEIEQIDRLKNLLSNELDRVLNLL